MIGGGAMGFDTAAPVDLRCGKYRPHHDFTQQLEHGHEIFRQTRAHQGQRVAAYCGGQGNTAAIERLGDLLG